MCEAEKAWERKIENRGIERGVEQGLQQGVEQGQNETIKAFAKSMSVEQIAAILDKSISEIECILKS